MRAWVKGLVAAAACIGMSTGAARAQSVPRAQWPAEVREGIDGWTAECRAAGGRLSVGQDYVARADFNGDGRPDYLIDSGALSCEGGSLSICSAVGNCEFTMLVSSGPGGRLVDTAETDNGGFMAPGVSIVRENGRDFVSMISRHGERSMLGWDGRTMRIMTVAERRRLGPARPVSPVPPAPTRPTPPPTQPTPPATPANWTVARDVQGEIAFARQGSAQVQTLGFACARPVGPQMLFRLFNLRQPVRMVGLTIAGERRIITMARVRDEWASNVNAGVLAGWIVQSGASEVRIDVDGVPAGAVSLAGAGAAIRQALAPCWTAPTGPATGPAISGPAVNEDAAILRAARLLFEDASNRGEPRFTPRMQAAIEVIDEAEMPMSYGNVICECQDTQNPRIVSATVVQRGNGTAAVDVVWSNFGRRLSRRVLLARTSNGWAVDDVLLGGQAGSLRAQGEPRGRR